MISEKRRRALAAYAGGGGGFVLIAPAVNTSLTLAALGIAASGLGTYLLRGTLTATGTGTFQTFVQVDSGVAANRYTTGNASGSAVTQLTRATGGAASTANSGSVAAGVAFSIGLAVLGTGDARFTLNGGTVAGVGGGPTSGLTTFRIGAGAAGSAPFVGTIAAVRVLPGIALSDAELQAMTANFL